MGESLRTRDSLRMMQAAPLSVKVSMTQQRIREWIREYGEDGVYISFSGGKDSTVLSHIVDDVFPGNHIPRVHIRTGLEYPEIEKFCEEKTHDLIILKPKKTFKQVIEQYGYPFISKEVSDTVEGAKKYLIALDKENENRKALLSRAEQSRAEQSRAEQSRAEQSRAEDCRISTTTKEFLDWENMTFVDKAQIVLNYTKPKQGLKLPIVGNQRLMRIMGKYPNKKEYSENNSSQFSCKRYNFLLDAPFNVSGKCCSVMKKEPAKRYAHQNNRHPMTGQMASESRLRTQQWIRNGCNGFQMKEPISNPMSFWTEQDVLRYIKENHIEICSVYGEIVEDNPEQLEGQMSFADFGLNNEFENETKLKTTGCSRTGCMFCAYGAHCKGDTRFC